MTKNASIPMKAPDSKKFFLLLLFLFLGGAVRCAYHWMDTIVTKRLIIAEQKKVEEVKQQIAVFSDIP
jgi:hypothetical protein